MTVKIDWHGDELLELIRQHTPEALFAVGEAFIEEAATKAPRRRGVLQKSGYVKNAKKSTYRAHKLHRKEVKLPDDDSTIASFAAFYTRFIELGTRTRSARPFIRPTLDGFKARAEGILKNNMTVKFR